MANWNQIRTKAKHAADRAKKTTGELADFASMQIKLKTLESKRDKKYTELGRLTYRQMRTGESQAARIANVMDELDEIREKIREQNKKISEAQKARAEAKENAKKEPDSSAE